MSWFLIIMMCANETAWSCSITTIPKPFKTNEICLSTGKAGKTAGAWSYWCIGVPD